LFFFCPFFKPFAWFTTTFTNESDDDGRNASNVGKKSGDVSGSVYFWLGAIVSAACKRAALKTGSYTDGLKTKWESESPTMHSNGEKWVMLCTTDERQIKLRSVFKRLSKVLRRRSAEN
jgi:hypothetical protein